MITCYNPSLSCTYCFVFQLSFSPICSHSTLELTKVNTWGLVYEWRGSDEDLKPILLAAHQGVGCTSFLSLSLHDPLPLDVVPVNEDTVDEWEYPPYSGHYDGALSSECDDMLLTI